MERFIRLMTIAAIVFFACTYYWKEWSPEARACKAKGGQVFIDGCYRDTKAELIPLDP